MRTLDRLLDEYLQKYLRSNRAAREISDSLDAVGVGFRPLVDHCTIRTLDVDQRAKPFIEMGYQWDASIGVLEFDSWWAKVYRKAGYPALFIDQAYDGSRGESSLIPQWVKAHGDECFHHIAVLVEDIDWAIEKLELKGYPMAGDIVGAPGTDLRQVFTSPELREGQVYTVLELIERHNGYAGFLPPQADVLMESTRRK